MVADRDVLSMLHAIAGHESTVAVLLDAEPDLATARLAADGTAATATQYFLDDCHLQLYKGDTALHVAAAAYDTSIARRLVAAGADVRARNRRGAEPLHSAIVGGPGSISWDPARQVAMIRYLVEVGAEVDATAAGGVTPLHRAVRNRCSAAVEALLALGADPQRTNDSGSTPMDLAGWTTGRGGSGSPEAKSEQARIIAVLDAAVAG